MTGRLRALRRRLTSDRRGLTSLEFGLIALPLTMFLFGVVEVGMAVRMKSALQYATAQAARCAAVNGALCGSIGTIQSYARTQTMGVEVSASAFTVTRETCGWQVVANVPFPIVAHSVMPNAITLSTRSCYPI